MVRHRTEAFGKGKRHNPEPADKFNLSELTENETLRGRWYTEFANDEAFNERDSHKWSSWGNRQSSWIQREFYFRQYMMLASISSWNSSTA